MGSRRKNRQQEQQAQVIGNINNNDPNCNNNKRNDCPTTSTKAAISKEDLNEIHFDRLVRDTSTRLFNDWRLTTKNSSNDRLSLNGQELNGDINQPEQQQHELNRLNQPKRPMNAFMVWGQAIRRHLHDRFSNVQNALLSKALGRVWRSLESAQKEPYIWQASVIKANHKRAYPNYRYQPRRIQEQRARQTPNRNQAPIDSWQHKIDSIELEHGLGGNCGGSSGAQVSSQNSSNSNGQTNSLSTSCGPIFRQTICESSISTNDLFPLDKTGQTTPSHPLEIIEYHPDPIAQPPLAGPYARPIVALDGARMSWHCENKDGASCFRMGSTNGLDSIQRQQQLEYSATIAGYPPLEQAPSYQQAHLEHARQPSPSLGQPPVSYHHHHQQQLYHQHHHYSSIQHQHWATTSNGSNNSHERLPIYGAHNMSSPHCSVRDAQMHHPATVSHARSEVVYY